MHSNWRPQGTDWVEGSVSGDLQAPRQRAMRVFGAREDLVPHSAAADVF